jgi:hypothetical protein
MTKTKAAVTTNSQLPQNVLSKNDIIKSVIKIKPYLEEYDNEPAEAY